MLAGVVDVIVVSEDTELLGAMAAAIEVAGFTVVARREQGRTEELVAFIRQYDPRVVVYDVGAPPIEGSIRRFKDLCTQPGAHPPYVITTPYPHKLDLHQCCAAECVRLDFDTLLEALRRASHRSPGGHANPAPQAR